MKLKFDGSKDFILMVLDHLEEFKVKLNEFCKDRFGSREFVGCLNIRKQGNTEFIFYWLRDGTICFIQDRDNRVKQEFLDQDGEVRCMQCNKSFPIRRMKYVIFGMTYHACCENCKDTSTGVSAHDFDTGESLETTEHRPLHIDDVGIDVIKEAIENDRVRT